ncbi:MAG: pyridoxamine 5'-phosphate oxidase family protein [Gammaproteobacteria bacterium]|nr:pyridoxamine 5'-phosphate oxidase family protein [Gammaproteobacteria bacterium]
MMKVHDSISPDMVHWMHKQAMFFVASAPLSAEGHVNLSPRGYDCFRVLSPNAVAWLDLTGSGNETAAHLQENGRITLMFCAFEGEPQILRLYGKGETLLPESPEWQQLIDQFPPLPGPRQIIRVNVERVQTSCGYSVPFMEYRADRDRLLDLSIKKGEAGLKEYRKQKNSRSIDGLDIKLKD